MPQLTAALLLCPVSDSSLAPLLRPLPVCAALRLWQEQMLKSRQLVLQQQAKSAQQQASKSQREVRQGTGRREIALHTTTAEPAE